VVGIKLKFIQQQHAEYQFGYAKQYEQPTADGIVIK